MFNFIATKANYECNMDIASNEGTPETFGVDIEPMGNFTFSWFLAVSYR